MKKTKREPSPVQELQVPEGQLHRRIWLTVLAILIAVGAFAFGISQLVKAIRGEDETWVTISAERYGGDLLFQYDVSAGTEGAVAAKKRVTAAYSALCAEAEALFGFDSETVSTKGLQWLSRHPNETVSVDAALFDALKLLEGAGDRTVYLAPLRADYDNLFLAQTEDEAAQYDPLTDPDAVAFRKDAMRHCSDAGMIALRLNSDGTVYLSVSDAYLAWAKENGVEQFLDLLWLKNAFVVDYIAAGLTAQGLTYGAISSYDGFTRNLDGTRTETYGQNLTDRADGTTYTAVQMQYTGSLTVVTMRSYPLYATDRFTCRLMADGSARTLYLDSADGICRMSVGTLLAAAKGKTCAEVALAVAPFYIADTPDDAALTACAGEEIDCLYVADRTVFYTSQHCLTPVQVYDNGDIRYSLKQLT